MHKIINATKTALLALVLSFGLSYVYAWTAPTSNPPTGNVSAPINTSATLQQKSGDFTVKNFVADMVNVGLPLNANAITAPKFCIGASCITAWPTSSAHGKQRFISSGTLTVPAGVTTVWVSMSGGGGGGGGYGGFPYSGGGGGGADAVMAVPVTVLANSSISVTIGLGGVGGYLSDGLSGGTSSFGTSVTTAGGAGGRSAVSAGNGSGGSPGGSGGVSGSNGNTIGGVGGGSIFGPGSGASVPTGGNGGGYGGGGSGGCGVPGCSGTAGNGANGFAMIEW